MTGSGGPASPNASSGARRPIVLPWREHASPHDLVDTGIDIIGRIPWGTHISMFCETKQDVLDAVCAYFRAASPEQEHCIWVVSDPLSVEEAEAGLRACISDFDRRRKAGRFELLAAEEWYFENGRFDWQRIVAAWQRRIDAAQAKGLAGVRSCGNPVWRRAQIWRDIVEYEHALEARLAHQRMIALCTYTTENSRPEDVLDIARTHQCVIARRSGQWQFLEVPGTEQAKQEHKVLNADLGVLPERFARDGLLTARERVVLAQLVRGASSKEAARVLGISPRTVDFHRANMMQKLGARNVADLIGKVLGPG